MNVRQFLILVVGVAIALAVVRYEPIRGENPFYSPVRESVADYLGDQAYRTPAVSHELNWVLAGLVLLGTIGGITLARNPAPRGRHKKRGARAIGV